MPEFAFWHQYFERHLGGCPSVFQTIVDERHSQREYTVPEQRPEWFDPSFEPIADWQPKARFDEKNWLCNTRNGQPWEVVRAELFARGFGSK